MQNSLTFLWLYAALLHVLCYWHRALKPCFLCMSKLRLVTRDVMQPTWNQAVDEKRTRLVNQTFIARSTNVRLRLTDHSCGCLTQLHNYRPKTVTRFTGQPQPDFGYTQKQGCNYYFTRGSGCKFWGFSSPLTVYSIAFGTIQKGWTDRDAVWDDEWVD